jgi:hypothetical protein
VIIYALLAACALYIAIAEGGLHAVALWNCLPVALGLVVAGRLRHRARAPGPIGAAVGFLIGSLGLSLIGHAAWQLDLGGTATASSTSGLLLIILPLYAVAAGLAGSVLGAVIGLCFRGRRPD